jgi:hypothetical protein
VLQDFITHERQTEVALTYTNQDVVTSLLVDPKHTIDIPVDTPPSINPRTFTVARPTRLQKATILLQVELKTMQKALKTTIQERFEQGLRQDYLAQVRVNAQLLNGFEGFNGELATLWAQKRGAKDKELAQYKIKNKRKNKMIKNDALDNEGKREEVAKLMQRLGHVGILAPDLEQLTLRTLAKTEDWQNKSGNMRSDGSVGGRQVVDIMNASPSEEEASHVGLGGMELAETSLEDAHLPPSVDMGSDNALREVELGETSVEGKNVLPSVDAESGTTTIEE